MSHTPEDVGYMLIHFPCHFPIKVIADSGKDFVHELLTLIQQKLPDFSLQDIEQRASRSNRYISLTCTVHVHSQAELDAVYRQITSHSSVRFVL